MMTAEELFELFGKKELLENFEKEKKRIKDSGDTSRPINPMDLD